MSEEKKYSVVKSETYFDIFSFRNFLFNFLELIGCLDKINLKFIKIWIDVEKIQIRLHFNQIKQLFDSTFFIFKWSKSKMPYPLKHLEYHFFHIAVPKVVQK